MISTRASNPDSRLRRVASPIRRSGYWIVLAVTALSYGLCAAQEGVNPNPIAFIAQLVAVAVALWVAEVPSTTLRWGWAAIGLAAGAVVAAELAGARGHVLDIVLAVASALACLITPTAIIAHQVRRRRPGMQNLLAAVIAYVMVGMLFTYVFNLLALVSATPVLSGETGDALRGQLFFSFATLTTLGYGNIVPLGPVAETVAIVEAITGQLFIVIALAGMLAVRGDVGGRPRPGDDTA